MVCHITLSLLTLLKCLKRLDKFWQEVIQCIFKRVSCFSRDNVIWKTVPCLVYDFKAQIHGTGSRSMLYLSYDEDRTQKAGLEANARAHWSPHVFTSTSCYLSLVRYTNTSMLTDKASQGAWLGPGASGTSIVQIITCPCYTVCAILLWRYAGSATVKPTTSSCDAMWLKGQSPPNVGQAPTFLQLCQNCCTTTTLITQCHSWTLCHKTSGSARRWNLAS